MSFSVRVRPDAARSAINGAQGDALKVSLAAPAAEGRANEECIDFFARLFHVKRSEVAIIQGAKGRSKVVRISGVSSTQVASALAPFA